MLNFIIKFLKRGREASNFSYDQAVIINISLDSFRKFGGVSEHDEVVSLEKKISDQLPTSSGIDGHEYGEGECVIYVYGPSADLIWKLIKKDINNSPFNHINITLQYGRPDDKSTTEKTFTV